jgi:Co/Zn/Cd efflux system component
MGATGGSRAIVAAFVANLGIAVTKFAAYLASGSSSMLAESVHSVADSGNQLLLLFGDRRARREPDREHPSSVRARRKTISCVSRLLSYSIPACGLSYTSRRSMWAPMS